MPPFLWLVWFSQRVTRALAEAPPDIREDFELLLSDLRINPTSRQLGVSASRDGRRNAYTVGFGHRNSILEFELLNEPPCIHLLMLLYRA